MKRTKYSAIKTLGQFKWLLLFAFTTSFAIGARTGNDLHPFTGEVQASAVLESPSKEDNTIVEASPTPNLNSPSVVGQKKAPLAIPTVPSEELGSPAYPTSAPELAVEAVDLTSGAGELEEAIVTAYSCGGLKTEAEIRMNCPSLLHGQPKTATGSLPIPLKTVACDRKYLHHQFEIEGVGAVTCTDTGGRIKGNRFDLYVETVQEARQFGVKKLAYKEV